MPRKLLLAALLTGIALFSLHTVQRVRQKETERRGGAGQTASDALPAPDAVSEEEPDAADADSTRTGGDARRGRGNAKSGSPASGSNEEVKAVPRWTWALEWVERWKKRLSPGTLSPQPQEGEEQEPLGTDPGKLAAWEQTRKFGFEFHEVPVSSDWTTGVSPDSLFLISKSRVGGRLLISAIPKQRRAAYSKNIRDHRGVSAKILEEFARRLALKEMKISELRSPIFDERKLLIDKLSGRMSAQGTPFKGDLFFFQTPSHFIGVLGLFPSDSSRFDNLLERMFKHLRVSTLQRPAPVHSKAQPPAEAQNEPEERVHSHPLPTPKRMTGGRKPWELPEEERRESASALEEETLDLLKQKDWTKGVHEICKTCQGKGGCPKRCDRGYVLCKLCQEKPPPPCKRCNGTGLRITENPFTRLDSWDYCPSCYGTGKKICANKCRGGKLRCKFCGGKGVCPDCSGQGYTR